MEPSLQNTIYFLPRGYFCKVIVGVCCLALQILALFQSNSYKVNVREYSLGISYVKKWGLLIILSDGSHILGDTEAASWDNIMFGVKVYCKIEMSPWALTLTKPIPEAFELPASDWPEKKFLANQRSGTARWLWCFLTWRRFPHHLPLLSSPFNWESFSREVSEKLLTKAKMFQKSCKQAWTSIM